MWLDIRFFFGFFLVYGNKEIDKIMKIDKFVEDLKYIDYELSM